MSGNGETRCACCGTPCQGFKGPDERQGDGSSVLTESEKGDDISQNSDINE